MMKDSERQEGATYPKTLKDNSSSNDQTTVSTEDASDMIGISLNSLLKLVDEDMFTIVNISNGENRLDRSEVEKFRDGRQHMQTELNNAANEARATGLFTRELKK